MLRCKLVNLSLLLAMSLVAVATLSQPCSLHAQGGAWKYTVLEIPPALKNNRIELGKLELLVKGVLRGDPERPLDANLAKFEGYFLQYYFRLLTQPGELKNLNEHREKLFKQYLHSAKSDTAHEKLNEICGRGMKALSQGNFHPALRYNAMMIIAQLNSREAVLFGNTAPADPWPTALSIMLAELDTSKSVSPARGQQIDAVRVAALQGVQRHVKLDKYRQAARRIPPTGVALIIERMLAIASDDTPPSGRTEEGHDWMRRQAVEVLGNLGSVGPKGIVPTALDKIVTNNKETLSLRCAAASALGSVDFSGDAAVAARKFGDLAMDAWRAEIKALADYSQQVVYLQQLASGSRATRSMREEGEGSLVSTSRLTPDPGRLANMSRRRLLHRLTMIREGIVGTDGNPNTLLARASGEDKTLVDGIVGVISGMMQSLDEKSLDESSLRSEMLATSEDLSRALRVTATATAPATPGGPSPGPGPGPGPGPSPGPGPGPGPGP